MLGDYGFGSGPATAAIGITSVWNTLVTLGLPVLAVLALVVVGDVEAWVWAAAAIGLVAVGLTVGLLVLVFRSESAAHRVGEISSSVSTRSSSGVVEAGNVLKRPRSFPTRRTGDCR